MLNEILQRSVKSERIKLNNPNTDFQKKYENYSDICRSVKSLKEQIRFLEEITEYRSPSQNSGTFGGYPYDKIGGNVGKIVDLKTELGEKQALMLELWEELALRINTLTNTNQRIVMTERYLNQKKWEQIAEDTHFSERWLMRIHKAALEKLG